MLQRSTKVIAGISIGIFILSSVACVVFFLIVSKQKVLLETLQIQQVEDRAHRESLKELTKILTESEKDRDSLSSRIIHEEDIINFLSLIESLGKEQGVVLTTQSLTVEPVNTLFESLVIRIGIQGMYQSVMNTIKLFELLPYQVTVQDLQLNRVTEGNDSEWTGTFTLTVTKFKKI